MPMVACPRFAGQHQRAVRVPPLFGRGGVRVISGAVVPVVVTCVQALAVMMIGIGRVLVVVMMMLMEIAATCGRAFVRSRGEMGVAAIVSGVLVDDERRRGRTRDPGERRDGHPGRPAQWHRSPS